MWRCSNTNDLSYKPQVLSAIVFFRIIRVPCALLRHVSFSTVIILVSGSRLCLFNRVFNFDSFNQKEISLTNLIITQTTTIRAKSTQNVENPFFNQIRNLQTAFSSKFSTQIGDLAVLNSLNINDTRQNSNSNPNWTQKTETLWTLPTNNSVLVKSQHHATSHHHRNEPVKLHHLALPATQTNQPPTIYVNRFLRERRREIKERWWEKEYIFFFLTIVRSNDSLLLARGGGGGG